MTRYHVDTTAPIRPAMAEAIHHAQLCGDGYYRQCIDVPDTARQRFERWANKNIAVIRYHAETR